MSLDHSDPSSPDLARIAAEDDFAGLMCARLCHDLISPAGAIGNGVELLRELGDAAGPELELVAGSAAQVTAALQFLRLAFGPAGPDDMTGLFAVQRLARGWFVHQRPALDWPDAHLETPLREARLLANLLQIGVAVLPRGGVVTVGAAPVDLEVHAAGRALLIPEGAEHWLVGAPCAEPATAREVHWLAAARHAAVCGLRLTMVRDAEALTLTARPA